MGMDKCFVCFCYLASYRYMFGMSLRYYYIVHILVLKALITHYILENHSFMYTNNGNINFALVLKFSIHLVCSGSGHFRHTHNTICININMTNSNLKTEMLELGLDVKLYICMYTVLRLVHI